MNANSNKNLLICAHGWAFGNWFWDRLVDLLDDHRIEYCSRPYFSKDEANFDAPESNWVGIGHSFGFQRLLQHDLSNCVGLVSLCGFHEFCSAEGNDPRILKRMLRAFDRDPAQVLADFYKNCGVEREVIESSWNVDALRTDLMALESEYTGTDELVANFKILALAGERDTIVPVQQSRVQFANLEVHPKAGHALGFEYADWCAVRIKQFLESL